MLLVCPECRGQLKGNTCLACGKEYSSVDGVPVLTSTQSIWQFDNTDASESVIEMAVEKGWREAALHHYGQESWIASEDRAQGALLTDIDENSVVVDAGCGWGCLSFSIASFVKEVYSFDSNPYGLRFMSCRKSQQETTNLFPALADLNSLPLPDNSVDLVILNGVLEWTPLSTPELKPEASQIKILREANRILKPGGQVFVGIENRYGFRYIFGLPDEHTGLRFITLMPRWLASAYYRLRMRGQYRVYTHNIKGLKRLLNASGFDSSKAYAPIPDYRSYTFIADLNAGAKFWEILLENIRRLGLKSFRYRIYHRIMKCFSFMEEDFIRQFANAFILLGRK